MQKFIYISISMGVIEFFFFKLLCMSCYKIFLHSHWNAHVPLFVYFMCRFLSTFAHFLINLFLHS